jgi:hypothetical protein
MRVSLGGGFHATGPRGDSVLLVYLGRARQQRYARSQSSWSMPSDRNRASAARRSCRIRSSE